MNWLRNLFRTKSAPTPPSLADAPQFEIKPDPDWQEFPDQAPRKRRSEELLLRNSIRINPNLPMIESEEETTLRTPQEVADRLSALVLCAFKASENPDQGLVDSIVAERGLYPLFTPSERAFVDDPKPDQRSRIQFSWRCEAAWPLLWALKHVEGPLGLPRETCNVPFLSETVYDTVNLQTRGLRPVAEILDEADLIYRCHWVVRQSGLDGEEPPGRLHPGVTMERHHGLNWLIGYNDGADWDDVTTDT